MSEKELKDYKQELKDKGFTDEQVDKIIAQVESKKIAQTLNEKVKQILNIMGFVFSGLGIVGYLITIFLLVFGAGGIMFVLMGKDGLFFIINFAYGLFIRSGFYIQGIIFAKTEFKVLLNEYYNLRVAKEKKRKIHSFGYKLTMEIIRTTLVQVGIFLISGAGLVYLAGFDGMNNPVYLWNAISNLFMFTGFGFLALNSSYEKYIIYRIPCIKEEIRKMKELKES